MFLYAAISLVVFLGTVECQQVPITILGRNEWVISEDEPVNETIVRISLDRDNDKYLSKVVIRPAEIVPHGFDLSSYFYIDNGGRVKLKKPLIGKAGAGFLIDLHLDVEGRYISKQIRVRVTRRGDRFTGHQSTLELALNGGNDVDIFDNLNQQSNNPHVNRCGTGGPRSLPILNLTPGTEWAVSPEAPADFHVDFLSLTVTSRIPYNVSILPENLVKVKEDGEVVLAGSPSSRKNGTHRLKVVTSNKDGLSCEYLKLKIGEGPEITAEDDLEVVTESFIPVYNFPSSIPVSNAGESNSAAESSSLSVTSVIVLVVSLLVIIFLILFILVCQIRKRKLKKKKSSEGNEATEEHKNELESQGSRKESGKIGQFLRRISRSGDKGRLFVFWQKSQENKYESSQKKSDSPRNSMNDTKDKWEFPRHRLKIISLLGEGNFGQVWKCEASRADDQKPFMVAVKTTKETAGEQDRKDLLDELEVLKRIGSHPNVISLVGCCNEKEPTFVILEYMCNGKLQTYLRESRGKLSFAYVGGDPKSLSPKDLTVFAFQIARGMEFLSSKKIIHRDLAARNILVGEGKICKVADFGFAKDVGYQQVYECRTQRKLPIRWMAPECLYDSIVTTKSDVWSFGILLWEVVTLGATPYPGMTAEQVMKWVKDGHRLERPEHCRREIYNIMWYCWEEDSEARPSFGELVKLLEKIILSEVEYIQLESFQQETYYNILSTEASGELV